LSALQDSDDLRARVVGLLLGSIVPHGDDTHPVAEQTRNAVVQLVVGQTDPAVYAIAVAMCARDASTSNDSACQQISLQRWAQLDPDNAAPWLLLAAKAQDARNGAAEADAFTRAAAAHKVDSYGNSLYAFAEPSIPQDATPLDRSYLAVELIGVETATVAPYGPVIRHCSADAMNSTNVRQQCNALAELLLTHGTTLLDLSVGKTIGAHAGWPAERLNELTLELQALQQATTEAASPDGDNPWTCTNVRSFKAYMTQRVRLGELAAARDALERSGETVDELAQKHSQWCLVQQHAAFERASAEFGVR
jgi:hypothetical protein